MRGTSYRDKGWAAITCAAVLVLAGVFGAGVAMAQAPGVCVPPPVGMVAWWPGDGHTLDIVGGTIGTWHGTTAYTAGEVAQAFSLNGASYVQVPSTAALSPTAAITIDAWINTTATNATSRIVDKITAGFGDGYLLDLLNGHLRLIADGRSVQEATTRTAGVTYHVAGTYDGQNAIVYVNGAVVASRSFVGVTPIPTNALPVRIGVDSTGAANLFTGWIDEVEIFNRALSQSEIQTIFNAGPAGKCKSVPIPVTSAQGLSLLGLLVVAAGLWFLRGRAALSTP